MANHKSAQKRARQNVKRRERNRTLRSATKSACKSALELVQKAGNREEALKALVAAERALQKAASKGVIPNERASRKTSRIADAVNKRFSA